MSTFLHFGKAHCHTKQIPEGVLIEATSAVLGLDEFDEATFKEQVREILVPAFNQLIFILSDGTQVDCSWKDRSRRESWTPEMRAKAAEYAKRRRRSCRE